LPLSEILNRPFYSNASLWFRLFQALIFGVFVALFLLIFQPFQINNLGDHWMLYAAGFGLITVLVMVILNVFCPLLFPLYFSGETWKLWKEILHSFINLLAIGAANSAYFLYLVSNQFSWEVYLRFQFFTVCVGLIPIVFFALYRERTDNRRYSEGSKSLNAAFHKKNNRPVEEGENSIHIQSRNKNEDVKMNLQELLFIRSMDNYLEIHGKHSKKVVRNTLKSVTDDLKDYPTLFRCHKSYIVNLNSIENITGNAQGYKLILSDHEEVIPVSRSLNEEIKKRLLSLT